MIKDQYLDEYRHEESFRGSKLEFREFFRRIEMKLFTNKLSVDGHNVVIPSNKELNYKVKYDTDDNYSVTIRVSWKKDEEFFKDIDEVDLD